MDITAYVAQAFIAMAIGAPLIAVFHWWERRRMRRLCRRAIDAMVQREMARREQRSAEGAC